MGRYFGIENETKKQKVSSYWKGDPNCDCHVVMHQLHWDKTDFISSACYSDSHVLEYDTETNRMIISDEIPNLVHSDGTHIDPSEKADSEQEFYGFDSVLCEDNKLDHVPNWNGNTCTDCGFVYDETLLPTYKKKFDATFFMN